MKREVIVPPPSPIRRLIARAAVIGLLASPFVAPRRMRRCGGSKVDIAKLTVQKFVNEAYPRWRREHGGCPRTLDDLVEYMDDPNTLDPWGAHYQMSCTSGVVVVWSLGEDGEPNTGDDLRSYD
jgi:hypothetical protein